MNTKDDIKWLEVPYITVIKHLESLHSRVSRSRHHDLIAAQPMVKEEGVQWV